jgi:hypothetical protein
MMIFLLSPSSLLSTTSFATSEFHFLIMEGKEKQDQTHARQKLAKGYLTTT